MIFANSKDMAYLLWKVIYVVYTYHTYIYIYMLVSKVVSTHLWNTPLNLYQQAMKGFLSFLARGIALGCALRVCCHLLGLYDLQHFTLRTRQYNRLRLDLCHLTFRQGPVPSSAVWGLVSLW